MKGKTVFILPSDQQFTINEVLNINPGDEVLIDDTSFGTEIRKCEVITHHLVKDNDSHKYHRRVFLL